MKKQLTILIITAVMVMIGSFSFPAFGYNTESMTLDEIFGWAKNAMDAPDDLETPAIILLDREGLQNAFKENNAKSFQRWKEEYGAVKAQKIIDNYLEELLGVFDPKTGKIFVGTFMEECRRNAVIAHEMVHYIQEIMDVPASSSFYMSSSDKHLFREFQAYKIEDDFKEEFCSVN